MMNAPQEIRLNASKNTLTVVFAEATYTLTAELLRVESPSAEVKGHGPGQKRLVAGKKEVTIQAIEPVGSYAVQLVFSDGHRTGIYTWNILRELGENQSQIWQDYLQELEQQGLAR